MKTRRDFIASCIASITCKTKGMLAIDSYGLTNVVEDVTTEDQRGDPDSPAEFITFSPSAIKHLASPSGRATFEDWDKNLSLSMIAIARGFIGCSRMVSPGQIAKFLELFDLPLKTDRGDVPFCAAGLSYCALSTYSNSLAHSNNGIKARDHLRKLMPDVEHYYFYPTVSCVDMYHIAAGKRRWVSHTAQAATLPKPGWIVLYDWSKRGAPDHCGLVQQATKDALVTIEFNTTTGIGSQRNGGTVAQKTRNYEYVMGFIITDMKP